MISPDDEMCDRCATHTRAVRLVICYLGCGHWQCREHADATDQERLDEDAYAAAHARKRPL